MVQAFSSPAAARVGRAGPSSGHWGCHAVLACRDLPVTWRGRAARALSPSRRWPMLPPSWRGSERRSMNLRSRAIGESIG